CTTPFTEIDSASSRSVASSKEYRVWCGLSSIWSREISRTSSPGVRAGAFSAAGGGITEAFAGGSVTGRGPGNNDSKPLPKARRFSGTDLSILLVFSDSVVISNPFRRQNDGIDSIYI